MGQAGMDAQGPKDAEGLRAKGGSASGLGSRRVWGSGQGNPHPLGGHGHGYPPFGTFGIRMPPPVLLGGNSEGLARGWCRTLDPTRPEPDP